MAVRYIMEAKENYPADIAVPLDLGAFANATYSEQFLIGMSFDPVRRKLTWIGMVWDGFEEIIPNDTGFTLWDGLAARAPGDDIDQLVEATLYVFQKDIDTGVVTATSTYDATNLVPAGIGGGDGTWRRYVSDLLHVQNYPAMVDPYTGDVWTHVESCNMYVFRLADGFAPILSPLRPVGNPNNAVKHLAISSDWVFAEERKTSSPTLGNPLYVVPRLTTAAETTADELLAYATYALPMPSGHAYYRMCLDADGALWLFGNHKDTLPGTTRYGLYKFTPPALGAYPATGGGWTDKTPWAAATGPDSNLGAPTNFDLDGWNRNIPMALRDTPHLVLINQLQETEISGGSSGDYRLDVTYYDTVAETFVTHNGVVTTYMDADWQPSNSSDGAWLIDTTTPLYELNPWLNQYDYDFTGDIDGLDYQVRWIWFCARKNEVDAPSQIVMVQYRFDPDAAPEVLQVIPEDGWDDRYTAYATAIGAEKVIKHSLLTANLAFDMGRDKFVYDLPTQAFWTGGTDTSTHPEDAALWQLDAAFTPRQAYVDPAANQNASPPFMRLTFQPIRRRAFAHAHIGAPA